MEKYGYQKNEGALNPHQNYKGFDTVISGYFFFQIKTKVILPFEISLKYRLSVLSR